jgi:hypothetical protein
MMMPISYNVAKQFPDYIITIIVEIPIKKWIMMMPISYNVVKWSPDYIIIIMVEFTSKLV